MAAKGSIAKHTSDAEKALTNMSKHLQKLSGLVSRLETQGPSPALLGAIEKAESHLDDHLERYHYATEGILSKRDQLAATSSDDEFIDDEDEESGEEDEEEDDGIEVLSDDGPLSQDFSNLPEEFQ